MNISERIQSLVSFFRNLILNFDAKHAEECAALEAAIAERDAVIEQLRSQLTEADAAIDAAIAEFTTPDPTNPTPGADIIIKQADALPIENTPEVTEAMESTVDTPIATSPEAVDAAVEMIVEAEAATAEDEPASEGDTVDA